MLCSKYDRWGNPRGRILRDLQYCNCPDCRPDYSAFQLSIIDNTLLEDVEAAKKQILEWDAVSERDPFHPLEMAIEYKREDMIRFFLSVRQDWPIRSRHTHCDLLRLAHHYDLSIETMDVILNHYPGLVDIKTTDYGFVGLCNTWFESPERIKLLVRHGMCEYHRRTIIFQIVASTGYVGSPSRRNLDEKQAIELIQLAEPEKANLSLGFIGHSIFHYMAMQAPKDPLLFDFLLQFDTNVNAEYESSDFTETPLDLYFQFTRYCQYETREEGVWEMVLKFYRLGSRPTKNMPEMYKEPQRRIFILLVLCIPLVHPVKRLSGTYLTKDMIRYLSRVL